METPLYLSVDEVAEMIGKMCLSCQKEMYNLLTKKVSKIRAQVVPQGLRELKFEELEKELSFGIDGNGGFLEKELTAICEREGVSTTAIRTPNNSARLVHIRRMFSKRARELGYSYPQIGRFLERHHTTILHLVKSKGCQGKIHNHTGFPQNAV